jgi:hypothetical protein
MDPTSEPRPTTPDATASPDVAVVAHLRANAPGVPAASFDGGAVTARARRALRRRRFRNFTVAVAAATVAYLALSVASPLPVPGYGKVSLPGSGVIAGLVEDIVPGQRIGAARRLADVDSLARQVLPPAERLELYLYLRSPQDCRVLEYPHGDFRDGGPECGADMVPFDATAAADYAEMAAAIGRSGVDLERIFRDGGGLYFQLSDLSWQYNYQYVYLPDGAAPPPPSGFAGEEWTNIRGDWWFHRAYDD